jgi:hypothetical protein
MQNVSFFMRNKYTHATFSSIQIVVLRSVNNFFLESYNFAAIALVYVSSIFFGISNQDISTPYDSDDGILLHRYGRLTKEKLNLPFLSCNVAVNVHFQ